MARAEYRRLLTEAYDLDKPEAHPAAVEHYLGVVRSASEPVLEAMSGSGRYLVPLLEAGVDVDGVDASDDMLAACVRRCEARDLSPALHRQWLHELDLPRRYGCILVVAASFGLVIDDGEVAAALGRLHDHLLPGGTLFVEIETPVSAPRRPGRWMGRWWIRPDGAKIVERRVDAYDAATLVETGLNIYELYVGDSLVETELNDWARRLWEPDDFAAALTSAGFADVRATRPLTDEPVDGTEAMVSFTARRG